MRESIAALGILVLLGPPILTAGSDPSAIIDRTWPWAFCKMTAVCATL
jgi:hypothetical protein